MAEATKLGRNLERWRRAVATHDVENPTHESYGIGLSQFDLERLGLEEGEELWSGIRVETINVVSGNFRVLCDGEHDDCKPKTLQQKEDRERQQEAVDSPEHEPVPA